MDGVVASNRRVVTVSEIARQARELLEGSFPALYVEGEVSNFTRAASGHWYFTLKDEKAQLRCAMFRGRNQAVRFKPANGMQVVVRGKLGLYEMRGEFQMVVDFMEEAGDGALRRAYEKLKAALQAEGLFDQARKKPLPSVPAHLAIITSPAGAAIHDALTVMARRFPALRATVVPAQVQGDGSAQQLVKALAQANAYQADPFDLILLTRGGGSLEDLWSFNTEPLARALAASRLPVVSAVGHESDFTIADLVADLRAPTPSAAAELITPDGQAWLSNFRSHEAQLVARMTQRLADHQRETTHLRRRLRHPERRLQDLQQRTDELSRRLVTQAQQRLKGARIPELAARLQAATRRQLDRQRARLASFRLVSPLAKLATWKTALATQTARLSPLAKLAAWKTAIVTQTARLARAEPAVRANLQAKLALAAEKLHTLSPLATLERGYAIVTDAAGHVLTSAAATQPGATIHARLQAGALTATITRTEET